jgi:hypothetical protein
MPLPRNHLAIPAAEYPPLQAYPCSNKFSWGAELRHLTSWKVLNIFWWPVFKFHQRWFTQSDFLLSCKKLPGFPKLWKTIQKGSFAYNTLFLGVNPLRRPKTDLADITTLALFFGDEFIDGLCETTGKEYIKVLVEDEPEKFNLKVRTQGGRITLAYCFDLSKVLPSCVMGKMNDKYGISYLKFYEVLQHFLNLINKSLQRLPFIKAEKTAHKIADACNTCFKSFLHDVNTPPEPGMIREVGTVLHFHESKTAYMQKKLLDLRCVLVDKEEVMNSSQAAGWMDIMRVIQIYDDIQDAVIDDGVQDNIVLSAAFHHFPAEWDWFCTNKNLIEQEKQTPLLLSLYMPESIALCMQLASEKIKTMNWEQQKIMHYLLFKHKYVLYTESNDKEFSGNNFLLHLYVTLRERLPHLSPNSIKSFAIDNCIHLSALKNRLLKEVGFSTSYQLQYNLHSLPAETKAKIFDLVTAKQF